MEKLTPSDELIIANDELIFQNQEKEKRAAELLVANKELIFQNKEKEKRAAELVVANIELAFQNEEKEKRAAELIIANRELVFQNQERENRAAELILANIELAYQSSEKESRAIELDAAYKELKKADKYLKEYIKGLEEMMFITSHKVRQPVANILGITNIITDYVNSPRQLRTLVTHLKESATSLDGFIKELTTFIYELEQKGKSKD